MPLFGWTAVTVPGAPKAWAAINERFGRLPLSEVLAPAVSYARDGYPCSPHLAHMWDISFRVYSKHLTAPPFAEWFRCFAPNGRAYTAGEIVRLPHHAETLAEIGETKAESFYSGRLARRISEQSEREGGYLRYEDLAAHTADWVRPIFLPYRGYTVCEIPPNGQGLAALLALNILKEFDFPERDCVLTAHRQIEAMKLAFADAFRYITDPADMELDPGRFLLPEYGAARAALIGERAQSYRHGLPPASGTVYLCCADGEGNMVSFIQSNYKGFGSGIVVKDTGIALQNRGMEFSLDPASANVLKPGKRTYHTIIPGFLMKDGAPVGPFGVMGGYMQPQGHLQLVMNYVDFHLNPQQALDAPRWQWYPGDSLTVEPRFSPALMQELAARGHRISCDPAVQTFGRGQMIVRLENKTLVGGTESRTDSNIACW